MEDGISARLRGRTEGRKFGLTVGTAFLVLSGVAFWRGRAATATVLASVGTVLLLGALIAPAHLAPVNAAWMRLSHLIAKVTTPIFVGAMFFLVFVPVGLLMRMFGKHPLTQAGTNAASYWIGRNTPGERRSNLHRQF